MVNWIPASWIQVVNNATAENLGVLLRLFGMAPTVNGIFVRAGGFGIRVITECSAIFVAILFISFVFAYPTTFKYKSTGLLLGIPALYCFNLLRLVFVFVSGVMGPTFFQYAHVYLGQIVMIVVVLTASLIWLQHTTAARTKDTPVAFFVRCLFFSTIPFLLWLFCHKAYVLGQYHLIKLVLGLFDYGFTIPERMDIYPTTFNTFNFVTYFALVLATNSLGNREKLKALLSGLVALSVVHLLFRASEVIIVRYSFRFSFLFVGLIILNQWVFPFALWLFIIRNEIFSGKKYYVCPVCGTEKVGIWQHIRAKHGEAALKDNRVKVLLEGQRSHLQENRNQLQQIGRGLTLHS